MPLTFGDDAAWTTQRRLEAFVDDSSESLGRFLSDPKLTALLDSAMQPLLEKALQEVRGEIERLRDEVANLDAGTLRRHGLGGDQLDAKTGIVRRLWERLAQTPVATLARRFLNAVDTLLDSLLDATGMGTAIAEVKDTIANAIED